MNKFNIMDLVRVTSDSIYYLASGRVISIEYKLTDTNSKSYMTYKVKFNWGELWFSEDSLESVT